MKQHPGDLRWQILTVDAVVSVFFWNSPRRKLLIFEVFSSDESVAFSAKK